jgi:hypothetical protein
MSSSYFEPLANMILSINGEQLSFAVRRRLGKGKPIDEILDRIGVPV